MKLNLREFEKSFNDLRCENFDLIATYRPYHFNGEDFGLYLYAEMFSMFFLSILRRTNLDFREAHTFALDSVLTHGSFHYLLERYATFAQKDFLESPSMYTTYKHRVYQKLWGTSECYEETLANRFIFLSYPSWDRRKKGYLEFIMQRQRDGYCEALDVTEDTAHNVFEKLEIQLLGDSGTLDYLKETSDLPSFADYVQASLPFRFIGLPVYLVNDCRKTEDFQRIVEVLFPQL